MAARFICARLPVPGRRLGWSVAAWIVLLATGDGSVALAQTTISVAATITLPAGDAPGGIATNPLTNRVYVVDGGTGESSGAVWVFDGRTYETIATITTAVPGFKSIAVNWKTNKVYVANQGAGSVTVIDGATNSVARSVPVPGCPTGIDVQPFTNRIYVSSQCTGDRLYVLDGATDTVLTSVALGGVAGTVAVDPLANRIYARINSTAATVVVDGRSNTIVKTIAGVIGLTVDPYTPRLWGLPSGGAPGLAFVQADDSIVTLASDLNIAAAIADPGTRRAYAVSSAPEATLVAADVTGVLFRVSGLPRVAAVTGAMAIIPEKRLFILNVDRTVSVIPLASDVLTIGNATATSANVTVPIYLKDAPATPLGIDSTARFSYPGGLALGKDGQFYVADTFNQTVRQIAGTTVTTIAGAPANVADGDGGPATAAHMLLPYGVATDASGNLYVADYSGSRIRRIAAGTGTISTVAGTGVRGFSGDGGNALGARLSLPTRLAIDSAGNLYICDSGNNRVRRVDAATGIITTVAGNGSSGASGDGGAATAAGISPFAIAIDPAGDLFIADDANRVIRKVRTATGVISTFAGSGNIGTADGPGTAASFFLPKGIASDAQGTLYVADFGNHNIRRISNGVVSTYAGVAGVSGSMNGPRINATFNAPIDVLADGDGTVFVSDYLNNAIRRIDVNGIVTTLAGVPGRTGTADGTPLPRIQGFSFTVYYSDPSKISGCTNATFPNCRVDFEPAGILAGKSGSTLSMGKSSNAISVDIHYIEATLLPFTGEAAQLGDLVGELTFVLSSSASESTIELDLVTPTSPAIFYPRVTDTSDTIIETAPDLLYGNGSITVAANTCLTAPTPSNVAMTFNGASSGCSSNGGTCQTSEVIAFAVTGFGYTFQSCDLVTWAFGDGSFGSGKTVQHVYSFDGPFTATVTISNSAGTVTLSKAVQVAGGNQSGCVLGLTSPTTGETWFKGTGQNVTWTRSGTCGSTFTIELLKGTALYDTITTAAIAATGVFTHTPPAAYASGSDYRIRIEDNATGATRTSGAFSIATVPVPQDTSSLQVLSGTLAGQTFSGASPNITVAPGQAISGTFFVSITSTFPSNAVMSIGVTPTWGDHATSYADLGHFSTPIANQSFVVPVNFTAPAATGTYYIVTAFNGEFNAGQVLSATNWGHGNAAPVWDDGNDVAGWSEAQIAEARVSGRAPGTVLYREGYGASNIPAAVVVVHVAVCTLSIDDPEGGETWVKGFTQNILWFPGEACGSTLDIELLKGGFLYDDLGQAATVARTITYIPPFSYDDGSDYTIRIRDVDSGTTAVSRFPFAIATDIGVCVLTCSAIVPAVTVTGTETTFFSQVVTPGCPDRVLYTWDYGDGVRIRAGSPAVSHVYAVSGTYAWSVTVDTGTSACVTSGTIEVLNVRRRATRH